MDLYKWVLLLSISAQILFWDCAYVEWLLLRAVLNETHIPNIHRLQKSTWTYFYSSVPGDWQHIEFLWSGVENLRSCTNKQPGSHSLPKHIAGVSLHGLYWATYSGIPWDIRRKAEKGKLLHPIIKHISKNCNWNCTLVVDRLYQVLVTVFCNLKERNVFCSRDSNVGFFL